MRESCTAILERVSCRDTLAARSAAAAGCIFCKARVADRGSITGPYAVLSGYAAGDVRATESHHTGAYELIGYLPLGWPPDWFPALSIRDAFVVDELAVWFASRGLSSPQFVWRDADFDEIIRTIWEKRIPVTTDEIVEILAAHAVPTIFHARARDRFDTGLRLLVWTKSRPPIKSRRLASFANVRVDPRMWKAKYGL